jgi:hypothetical protein
MYPGSSSMRRMRRDTIQSGDARRQRVQEPQDVQQTQAAQDAQQTQAEQDVQQTQQMQETTTRTPRGRTLGLAALAGAVVVGVLAVGFAIGSGATSKDAAGVPTSGRQPAGITEAGWTSPDGRTQVRLDGRGGPGFGGGSERGAISITAIDGTKLSLKTDNDWTRTIDAAGATVTKDGETVALSTLKVGDRIVFRETRNDDGTYTITAITVVQPTVSGTVASVSGSTVTVTTRDGSTSKVALTGSTTYTIDGTAATKDAVVAGVRISATGTLASDGTLTTTSVQIEPAMVAGTVKEKATSSLTLTTRDGSTVVVKVSSSTTYEVDGITSPTLADVKVGDVVMASGTKNADGSLSATSVRSHAAGDFGGPGMGGWGRGGHGGDGGRGFPGGGWGDPDASPAPSSAPASGANG